MDPIETGQLTETSQPADNVQTPTESSTPDTHAPSPEEDELENLNVSFTDDGLPNHEAARLIVTIIRIQNNMLKAKKGKKTPLDKIVKKSIDMLGKLIVRSEDTIYLSIYDKHAVDDRDDVENDDIGLTKEAKDSLLRNLTADEVTLVIEESKKHKRPDYTKQDDNPDDERTDSTYIDDAAKEDRGKGKKKGLKKQKKGKEPIDNLDELDDEELHALATINATPSEPIT
ncbi:hypothetical protein HK097_001015 [Rhizophlyctis rosea]|uniref:Uncharacterized protein n=1 Tax=Rhizophlyctis rosea TaxID=64517 RepID=A0AAD5S726_9FUNG|nr:hypothetical protein HK097_001015 [Rhizophlyctis rosea]